MNIIVSSCSKTSIPLVRVLEQGNSVVGVPDLCSGQVENWSDFGMAILDICQWIPGVSGQGLMKDLVHLYTRNPKILVILHGEVPVGLTLWLHRRLPGYELCYCACEGVCIEDNKVKVRLAIGTDLDDMPSCLMANALRARIMSGCGNSRILSLIVDFNSAEKTFLFSSGYRISRICLRDRCILHENIPVTPEDRNEALHRLIPRILYLIDRNMDTRQSAGSSKRILGLFLSGSEYIPVMTSLCDMLRKKEVQIIRYDRKEGNDELEPFMNRSACILADRYDECLNRVSYKVYTWKLLTVRAK